MIATQQHRTTPHMQSTHQGRALRRREGSSGRALAAAMQGKADAEANEMEAPRRTWKDIEGLFLSNKFDQCLILPARRGQARSRRFESLQVPVVNLPGTGRPRRLNHGNSDNSCEHSKLVFI